jgi:hypothetical protein
VVVIDELKRRPDIITFRLGETSRDDLPDLVVARLLAPRGA